MAGNHPQPTSDGEGFGHGIDSSCVSTATETAGQESSLAIVGVL